MVPAARRSRRRSNISDGQASNAQEVIREDHPGRKNPECWAWSATIDCPGKHHLESPSAALKTLDCDEAQWKEQLNPVRCGWRVIGGSVQMHELAQRMGQQRFKRRSRRPDPDRDAALRMESG